MAMNIGAYQNDGMDIGAYQTAAAVAGGGGGGHHLNIRGLLRMLFRR